MYLDPNTPTCKSCTGPNCRDNILPEILLQKKLTSGYFSVFSSTKPAGREVWHPMCNVDLLCKSSGWLEFGSQIYTHIIFFQASVAMVALSTETSSREPTGGINKDDIRSDHGFLHQRAAEMAINATVEVLQDIRLATGDQAFLRYETFLLHHTWFWTLL